MDATESRTRNRPAAIVGLALVLAVVPACTASAGNRLVRRPAGEAVVVPAPPYVTYRPTYPTPARSFVLSSYAGANYPSNLPGAAVTPTEFRVLTGKPVRPHAGWFGLGW